MIINLLLVKKNYYNLLLLSGSVPRGEVGRCTSALRRRHVCRVGAPEEPHPRDHHRKGSTERKMVDRQEENIIQE